MELKADEAAHGPPSPHWKAGPFNIRLPFVHYKIEWPDYIQGLLVCVVDLGAIPLMVDALGMPFEVALAVVMLNGLLYLTHHMLGDPVVPGWITPAVPLLIVYVGSFPEEERVWALISFQFVLGIFSIFMGATGLAKKVARFIPSALLPASSSVQVSPRLSPSSRKAGASTKCPSPSPWPLCWASCSCIPPAFCA